MSLRRNLELMLERGQDSPLLRFALGQECLKAGDLVSNPPPSANRARDLARAGGNGDAPEDPLTSSDRHPRR